MALNDGGTFINTACAQQMVQNYADIMYKKRADGTVTEVDPQTDALSTWYSKKMIDQFFADNGYTGDPGQEDSFGLRIYNGLHGDSAIEQQQMPDLPANWLWQQTSVLVVTIEDASGVNEDNLAPIGSVSAALGGGGEMAMDEGNICPPPPPGLTCTGAGSKIVVE